MACPSALPMVRRTYYRTQKSPRQGPGADIRLPCALRCLGQRWLKSLWNLWQTHQPYDEQVHTRNQVRHGAWVLTLAAAR